MAGILKILDKFYQTVIAMYTLGLHLKFAERFRYIAHGDEENILSREHDQFLESLAGYRQWEDILNRMKPIWKVACTVCALLFSSVATISTLAKILYRLHSHVVKSLSIAFLQIGGILEGSSAETTVMLLSIFSCAGLAMNSMYIAMGSNLGNVSVRNKWVEVRITSRILVLPPLRWKLSRHPEASSQ